MTLSVFCQLPIGKDMKEGKAQFKQFMKDKGYHFLSEGQSYTMNLATKKMDVPASFDILFKEEIMASIENNMYDNIVRIDINTEDKSTFDTLIIKLGFENWKYLYSYKNNFQQIDYYQIDNYYVILSPNYRTVGFVRSLPNTK
jgi:hypothetical protein